MTFTEKSIKNAKLRLFLNLHTRGTTKFLNKNEFRQTLNKIMSQHILELSTKTNYCTYTRRAKT